MTDSYFKKRMSGLDMASMFGIQVDRGSSAGFSRNPSVDRQIGPRDMQTNAPTVYRLSESAILYRQLNAGEWVPYDVPLVIYAGTAGAMIKNLSQIQWKRAGQKTAYILENHSTSIDLQNIHNQPKAELVAISGLMQEHWLVHPHHLTPMFQGMNNPSMRGPGNGGGRGGMLLG